MELHRDTELEVKLFQYALRNLKFIKDNSIEKTFQWIKLFIQDQPLKEMNRKEIGDTIFECNLKLMANWNSIIQYFSKDNLEEKLLLNIFIDIERQKEILEISVSK